MTIEYTAIVAGENDDIAALPASAQVVETVMSNTDGPLHLLTIRRLAPVSETTTVKAMLSELASLGFPVLGFGKRRSSSGKGLFMCVPFISIDGVEARVEEPTKFRALLVREAKFSKGQRVESASGLFRGIEFKVTRDVMRPCAASSVLVDAVLEIISGGARVVLDAGTGSGCLLVSVLRETSCGRCRGVGLDVSMAALEVARANAEAAGVLERCEFVEGDFGKMSACVVGGDVDLVVANPPYHIRSSFDQGPSMASRRNDPGLALFAGGKDGLDAYRALGGGGGVGSVLKEGGFVVVEVPHDAAARCFVEALGTGWKEVKRLLYCGCIRGVVLRKSH